MTTFAPVSVRRRPKIPSGTSGDYTTLFYWLDGSGDLNQHIGHRVEIAGDLKGDVKEGEITTDRPPIQLLVSRTT